jgi:hypothetical protein
MSASAYYHTQVEVPVKEYDTQHQYKQYNYSWNDALREGNASTATNDLGFIQPPESSPETLPIRLTPLDANNYLDETSARYNVTMHLSDLLLKQHMRFMDGSGNGYTSGVGVNHFMAVNGFFNYDPTFFIDNQHQKNMFESQHASSTSIEIFCYFCPPETGQYRIEMSSPSGNIGSMLWIGDEALVNYQIHNAMTSTRGNVSTARTFHAGKQYPLRIQSGKIDPNVPDDAVFHIYQNGQLLAQPEQEKLVMTSIRTIRDAANQPYEPLQLYYALTTSPATPVGLFQCLTTPVDVNNNHANNEALRLCRKGGSKYTMGRIPLATTNNGGNSPMALLFRSDGNLVVVSASDVATATAPAAAAESTPLFSFTNMTNKSNCKSSGVGFDAVPDVQVGGVSIGSWLKPIKTSLTDPKTGLQYSQYAYGSYTPTAADAANVPKTEPGTTYTMKYSLGGEPRSTQASFDSPNNVTVDNLDKVIQCNSKFLINNDGNLIIQSSNEVGDTVQLWSLFTDPQYSGIASQIQVDASAAVVNPDWYQQYYQSYTAQPPRPLHTLKTGEFVSSTLPGARPYLISSNGKYRLAIEGNRVMFQYCLPADNSKKYTDINANPHRYYLFHTDMADMRLGSTFVVDNSGRSMKYVPPASQASTGAGASAGSPATSPGSTTEGILHRNNQWTQYTDAYPPNVAADDRRYQHRSGVDASACQQLCTDVSSEGCTHFYSYIDDADKPHCTIGTGGSTLRYYPQNNVDGGIKSSSVYVRGQSIQTKCAPNDRKPVIVPVNAFSDMATDPLPWKIETAPYIPAPDREGPCGVDSIYTAYHQFEKEKSTSVPDTVTTPAINAKESFVSKDLPGSVLGGWRETFTSSSMQACTSGTTYNMSQCKTDMSAALNSITTSPYAAEYAKNRFTNIHANYVDISNHLNTYSTLNTDVNGQSMYDAIDGSGNLQLGDRSHNYRRSIKYAHNQDTKQRMLLENKLYIIGTILTASCLIGLFLLPK